MRSVVEIDKRNDSVSGIFPNSIIIKTDKEEVPSSIFKFKHFFASFVTREITFYLLIRLWKSISRQTIPLQTFTSKTIDSEQDFSFELSSIHDFKGDNHPPCQKRHSKSESEYIIHEGPTGGRSRSAPEAWSLSRIDHFKESESIQMMESRGFISKSLASLDVGPMIDLARELPSFKDTRELPSFKDTRVKSVDNEPCVLSTPMVLFSSISCDCNLDKSKFKVLVDHSFQTNTSNLWKILYGSSTNGFMRTLWEEIGYKGIQVSAWEPEGASSLTKNTPNELLIEDIQVGYTQNLEYIVPSTNPIGPKEIQTFVKNRVIAKESSNSTICLVQISKTPFVTSGDCFEVHLRSCLTHDGHLKSKLRVAAQVVFIKSTWIRSKFTD